MANSSTNSGNSNPTDPADGVDNLGPIRRVHELTWALLDEQISEAELAEMEALLLADKSARDAYVRCVQMHVDLTLHFKPQAAPQFTPPATNTPILGMLAEGLPQIGSPQVGDAT